MVNILARVNICGIDIDNISYPKLLSIISYVVDNQKNIYIVAPNVDHIVKLQKDEAFRKVYKEAYLVLPDGMFIIWASRFLGTPLQEKISGSDLVPIVCKLAASKGYKVFFLGGRPGAAEGAEHNLRKIFPALKIVGAYAPPFGFEKDNAETEKILAMIKDTKPDILFVGLGAPKQEIWINRYYKQLGVPFSMGIGVSFEFLAGMVKRAPKLMQRAGLEWLWRLICEPKRLWRRYLVEDPVFFWYVLRQRLKK